MLNYTYKRAHNFLTQSIRFNSVQAEKNLKLAVLRRNWSVEDLQRLDEVVDIEFRRAEEENQQALKKSLQIPDGLWKYQRIEQLKRWKTIPAIKYATFEVKDSLNSCLSDFLGKALHFHDDDNTDIVLSNKPPVLHWTITPLDTEVQIVIRISFPLVGPDQATFINIQNSLRNYFNSAYEWTQGILLTADVVRLHIERVHRTVIELSCRICEDELEDDQVSTPTKLLWPYLAIALKNTLNEINKHQYLQYTLELIPFGMCFFKPPLKVRVFDLSLFMATAYEYGKVSFRYQDELYDIILEKLLPDGTFVSLDQLLSVKPPKLYKQQMNTIDSDKSVTRESNRDSTTSTAQLSVNHNRGRRVSFGSIKLIDDVTKPVKGVDEYVDEMLKQTMDHLII
ncbi:hypothetical protein DICVIV_04369 [Dictyocaulus viviparus]|uniref:Uncharacterized protein n=1 Tax=Dictyocaulus viviparus TaxID=29172 RepID=A0A0D8XYB7_DICVI|nr:hypothetical protein DICVIV_04369 [Dictyocaulus viviparus]